MVGELKMHYFGSPLLQLMFSDPVKGDELAGSVTPAVSFGAE